MRCSGSSAELAFGGSIRHLRPEEVKAGTAKPGREAEAQQTGGGCGTFTLCAAGAGAIYNSKKRRPVRTREPRP